LDWSNRYLNTLTYRQDPTTGAVTYILEDTRLVVRVRSLRGGTREVFLLKDLSPEYHRISKRIGAHVVIASLFTVAPVAAAIWVWFNVGDRRISFLALGVLAGVTVATLKVALDHLEPVEIAVFTSRNGEKSIEVFRSRKRGASTMAYEDFVHSLGERIRVNSHPQV
jgi:hypothetical protein